MNRREFPLLHLCECRRILFLYFFFFSLQHVIVPVFFIYIYFYVYIYTLFPLRTRDPISKLDSRVGWFQKRFREYTCFVASSFVLTPRSGAFPLSSFYISHSFIYTTSIASFIRLHASQTGNELYVKSQFFFIFILILYFSVINPSC